MAEKSLAARGDRSLPSSRSEIDAFLAGVRERASNTRGWLVFALDATMSRQPTWDTACRLQADMFGEAAAIGGLEIQLVYYRGLNECKASGWISNAQQLANTMAKIFCISGETQIRKVFKHTQKQTRLLRVSAMVFVGDAVEESADTLAQEAGELRRLSVPVFMFQEGQDQQVEQTFRNIAHLTGGAYCRFDSGAAQQLGGLLRAVATFACGGVTALAARKDPEAIKLLTQITAR